MEPWFKDLLNCPSLLSSNYGSDFSMKTVHHFVETPQIPCKMRHCGCGHTVQFCEHIIQIHFICLSNELQFRLNQSSNQSCTVSSSSAMLTSSSYLLSLFPFLHLSPNTRGHLRPLLGSDRWFKYFTNWIWGKLVKISSGAAFFVFLYKKGSYLSGNSGIAHWDLRS